MKLIAFLTYWIKIYDHQNIPMNMTPSWKCEAKSNLIVCSIVIEVSNQVNYFMKCKTSLLAAAFFGF